MCALGVDLKEQWPQDAVVGGLEGRRHERESRSLGGEAQWQPNCLLMELITARAAITFHSRVK